MDAWDALDVDDSDLPSLLRPSSLLPCKRSQPHRHHHHHHQHQESNEANNNFAPIFSLSLDPCSQLLHPSQSQPNPINPETLDSQSEQPLPQVEEKALSTPSTSGRYIIPGPAGAIQAAMHRQVSSNQNLSHGEDRIPTQDYLRRALEDGDDDKDFKLNSWLCAMDFLHKEGIGVDVEENVVLRSPLSSIKTCLSTDRVPQVVAVIKSCMPNGLGDLIVTLKDPTGTVGANIHRKVLTESEFGKDISVGSVLILQQVAAFSPSRSAHYLNITLSNVVKVISKDSGPPSTQRSPATTVRCAASRTEDCRETRPGMAEKASFVRWGAAEGILNEAVGKHANKKGAVDDDRQMEEDSPAAGSFHCSNRYQRAAAVEPLVVRREAANGTTMEVVRKDANYEEQTVDVNDRLPNEEVGPLRSFNCSHASAAAKLVEDPNVHKTISTSGVKEQRQQLISRVSLPQWTDEQLEELFDASSDDGTSPF